MKRDRKKEIPILLTSLALLVLSLFMLTQPSFATNTTPENISNKRTMHLWDYFIAQAQDRDTSDTDKNTREAEDNLRIHLRALLHEHTALAHSATVNHYSQTPDAEAAIQALRMNGDLIIQISDQEDNNRLRELWQYHNDLYLQYADALRENNEEGRQQVRTELHNWADEVATVLDDNQDSDLQSHLRHHVDLTASVIDAHATGNHQEEYERAHTAFEQAGTLADMLYFSMSQ